MTEPAVEGSQSEPPMHLGEYAGLVVKNTFIDCNTPQGSPSPTRRRCRAMSAPSLPRATSAVLEEDAGRPRPPSPPLDEVNTPPGDVVPEMPVHSFRLGRHPSRYADDDFAADDDAEAVHTPAGCTWPATPEAHNMPFFIPSSTGTLLSGMRMAAIGGSAFGGQKAAPKARALALEAKAAAQQPRMTAIAQLQELLQAVEYAEHFRYPPGTSVLQWTYGEHQLAPGQAEFRAVVAFLRDGVAHHVSGEWERSKKLARQSAADAALVLLRDSCAPHNGNASTRVFIDTAELVCKVSALPAASEDDVQLLQQICSRMGLPSARWSSQCTSDRSWQAMVEIRLHNIPHTFSGVSCANPEAAKGDVARRTMWYLEAGDLEGLYEPDVLKLLSADCKVSAPPSSWARSVDVSCK